MSTDDLCDELDGLLSADDETGLSLDEAHGFMSAALCGPRLFSFSEVLCALMLPEADGQESECELPSRLLELLKVLYEDTQRAIADGSFVPVVACEQNSGGEDINVDAGQWCRGFLMCVERSRARWKLENSRVLELLTPIVLLADEREFDRVAKQLQDIDADSFRQELLEELPVSVCAFRKLFIKKPRVARPARAAARPSKKR